MTSNGLTPGIYYIRHNDYLRSYELVYNSPKFELPKKTYGDINSKVIRVWNHYAIEDKSVGCLLTGIPGSGKTHAGKILANIAIDNDIPVVMCVEIKFNLELIRFLSNLSRCVLFLDEFKKNVDYKLEEQMLTMLVDVNNTKKIFVITENDSLAISSLIRNRPERIRYHYVFDKLSRATYEDYCKEYEVTPSFKQDLDDLYKRIQYFSFDQLQSILTEHVNYPQDSLDDLLTTLNLHSLARVKFLKLVGYEISPLEPNVKYELSLTNKLTTAELMSTGVGVCIRIDITGEHGEKDVTQEFFPWRDVVVEDDRYILNATSRLTNKKFHLEFRMEYE